MNWTPIIALASLLASTVACGGDGESAHPLMGALDQSEQTWLMLEESNDATYRYTVETSSFSGFSTSTEIVVVNDEVVERHYTQTSVPDGTPETYSEIGAEVGTHSSGASPVTIGVLYQRCRDEVLTQDVQENMFYLGFHPNGVMEYCQYVPNGCQDDCAMGVSIDTLTF